MSISTIKIGIIGGSGLNDPQILEKRSEIAVDTPFGKPSDVLIEGFIKGVPCVLLARHGRKHSIMPSNVNYRANIWALKTVGCTHVIVSTATGSLQENIKPGDVVIIDDAIDRTKERKQTFYDGAALSPPGVCHLPMSPLFCAKTRQVLIDTAKELNIHCHESGTAITIEGPRFSTRAESLMFKQWGGHVINMTTMPEVVLAKEAGLCYAAVALATDYDCWRECGDSVCVTDVLSTFKKNISKVTDILINAVPKIASINWTDSINSLQETVKSSVMLQH